MKKQLLLTTISILFSTISFGQMPIDSLISYYPFNNNANDESVNTNNGTINGATLVEDRFGNANSAMNFKNESNTRGQGESISINTFKSTDELSFSLWAKSDTLTDGSRLLTFEPNGNFVLMMYFINGKDSIYFHTNTPSNKRYICKSFIDDKYLKWNHYAFTLKSNDSLRIYINGVKTATLLFDDEIRKVTGEILFGHPTNYYKGNLDDIRIYNRRLTSYEIQALANDGNVTCNKTIYDTISVQDTLIIKTTINGINNTVINHTTKVYPNPAKDFVNFDFTNYTDLNGYSVKIINNVSQEVYSTEITQQNESIELSSLGAKGLYFIQILNAKNELVEVRKLLIE